MCERDLELIRSNTFFLNAGQLSSEIKLDGDKEGDMFFAILIKYVPAGTEGTTLLTVIDDYHAQLTIETQPTALTTLKEPIEIGTYQSKTLYLEVVVEPCIASEQPHRVAVNFYTKKADNNGTE